MNGRKDCCKLEANLETIESGVDRLVRRCILCKCRHFEATLDGMNAAKNGVLTLTARQREQANTRTPLGSVSILVLDNGQVELSVNAIPRDQLRRVLEAALEIEARHAREGN